MGVCFRDFTDIRKDGKPRRRINFGRETLELQEVEKQLINRSGDGCLFHPVSCLGCPLPIECIWDLPQRERSKLGKTLGLTFRHERMYWRDNNES